jgi:hypothetical protein
MANTPIFRVETYQLAAGDFSGATFNLRLRHELSVNYFVLCQWAVNSASDTLPSDVGVQVTQDPYGTGDLAVAGGNWLQLKRTTSVGCNADLVVTVVECLADSEGAGFKLVDVAMTAMGTVGAPGTQTVVDTCAAWTNLDHVVTFGGFRGGGLSCGVAAAANQVFSLGVKVYPSGTNQLNFERFTPNPAQLLTCSVTTYVVEWGSEWTVDRVSVLGTNSGATLSLAAHYSTATLTYPAVRANTWCWSTGWTDGLDCGSMALAQVATIGDGAAQLALETKAAVGCCQGLAARSVDVFVLQHAKLTTDWVFKTAAMGAGSMDLTVDAVLEDEVYSLADSLYAASTRGRLPHLQASVPSALTSDLSEALLVSRPTGSTKVRATTLDPAPALAWVGWLESADFSQVTTKQDSLPSFRVTTYRITGATFTGTTYDLTLKNPLVPNYFAMVIGTDTAVATPNPADGNAWVSQDPYGTGDLGVSSSSKVIRLARGNNAHAWAGEVIVVECLRGSAHQGFRLVDVKAVALPAMADTGVQVVNATANAPWTTPDRVVLFGGHRGGGLQPTVAHGAADIQSQGVALVPTGTSGIQAMRYSASATSLLAMTAWVYVVEWGDEWQVQQLLVQATGGGPDVNATGDYQTFYLTDAVDPTKTLVWGGFCAEASTTDSCWLSPAMGLGDGVAQAASESRLSIGLWQPNAFLGAIYVLSHADLKNQWGYIATNNALQVLQSITAPVRSEGYSSLVTCGQRGGLGYTANSGNASPPAVSGAEFFLRPTAQTTLAINRENNTGSWAGWVQTFDFGGLYTAAGGIEVATDDALAGTPQQYLVLQDPQWDGSTNLIRVTSEGGISAGPVQPDVSNLGSVVGYQEGTPTADTELRYLLREGGVGGSGGWLWRYTSETTAESWRAMNALTQLWRQQTVDTGARWAAHDIAYSTVFRRVLIAKTMSATNIRIYYKDVDDFTLAAWSIVNITTTGLIDPATTTRNGLGLCELPDGSMLLAYPQKSTAGTINLATQVSTDGGLTWTRSGSRVLSKTSIGALVSVGAAAACNGQHQLESSGDWVRCAFLTTNDAGHTYATMETIVSPDRGSSWKAVTTARYIQSWGGLGGGPQISYPFGIVGVGDVSGTFILAHLPSSCDTVRFAIAARDEDWATYAALDWDLSSYATSALVKAVWFVRDPERIWCFAWVEGTDASEIVVATCNPADPTNPASWVNMGILTGFAGVMRYGPHAPRGCWAGHRLIHSAGLYDSTVAVGADPVVAGQWTVQSGGYDPEPWDYSLLDWASSDIFMSSPAVCSYQWSPCLGDPAGGGAASSAITPWVRTVVGAPVFVWSKDEVQITSGAAADVGRYDLVLGLPASTKDRWGRYGTGSVDRGYVFQIRAKVTAQRVDPLTSDDGGVRIIALATAPFGYDFSVRIGNNRIAIYDNAAPGLVSSVAMTDFTEECELRIVLANGTVGLRWRKVSAGPLAVWTELAPAALASGNYASQEIYVGLLAATGAGTVSVFKWSGLEISRRSDLGQMFDLVKPTDLMGTRLNRNAILAANGVRVRWGGSGATDQDYFTGELDHQRGAQNFSMDSPRYYWESTTLAAQELVFKCDLVSSKPRWQMNALFLVGTVDRTCTLQFSNTDTAAAWLAPAAEFALDADIYTDLTVLAVDGSAVQVQTSSGAVFSPRRGMLLGCYLRFTTAGGASGCTVELKNQVADDGWLHAKGGIDLVSIGVAPGAKACIYGDRMVFMGKAFQQYHFFRLVFPDLSAVAYIMGTSTGTHRLGSMIPGFWQRFDVPLEWSITDSEQPNVTEYRAKGGASWQYEEGPAQRTFKGMIVGDYPDQQRRSVRDMLRGFHGYSVHPVGLVLDSTNPSRDTLVFGRWDSGGQMDDAAWYPDSDGVWRQAGDTDLTFIEEV